MAKHAFLIIAHNEFGILKRLISVLDHKDVDIYVHFDAKVKTLPELSCSESKLFVLDKRVDTRWGHVSQIETEYRLSEDSYTNGPYDYYHLISGVHLPLRAVDSLLASFDAVSDKTVFHSLAKDVWYQEDMKVQRYNFLMRHFSRSRYVQLLWRVAQTVQRILRIRRFPDVNFYKASNWASFTNEAICCLLNQRKRIMKRYRFSFCADEYFAPTALMESGFKDKIISVDNMLFHEMGEASPRVLTMDDYDQIRCSGCLFARKFSESHMDVVDRLIKEIHLK